MAKKLYRWSDKQYDQEYWGRMERNWRRWKGKKPVRRGAIKTILEEEEMEEEKSGVREYHKWSLTICDGCFDTLKSSKMRS